MSALCALGVLLAAVIGLSHADTLYVQPVPAGKTIDGEQGKGSIQAESPQMCAEKWYENLPAAFGFQADTKTCVPYKAVYGLKDSETERGYIPDLNATQCPLLFDEYLNTKTSCRRGWTTLVLSNFIGCYYVMYYGEYEAASPGRKNWINACRIKYPYSSAASVHSKEESDAIADNIKVDPRGIFGVKIGLVMSPAGECVKWVDDTPLDYCPLSKDTKGYCGKYSDYCSHGCIYWTVNSKDSYWSQGDSNYRAVLCKYTLRTL